MVDILIYNFYSILNGRRLINIENSLNANFAKKLNVFFLHAVPILYLLRTV